MLSLLHLKTLELDEGTQCAKVSPDNKLLAAALLDNTVKIFFMDTFKVYIDFGLMSLLYIFNVSMCNKYILINYISALY